MLEIPDLRTSSQMAADRVQAFRGDLAGAPPLMEALEIAARDIRNQTLRPGGGFRITIDSGGRARVQVADQASLARLRLLLEQTRQPISEDDLVLECEQTPSFANRAVLECFYGELWSPDDRDAVIRAAAASGANLFVYGPAADRLTGGGWRDPYCGSPKDNLEQLRTSAHAEGMRGVWRVSPAAPLEPSHAIRVGERHEIEALITKVQAALDLGFDAVLIAFDDIPDGLDVQARALYADAEHPLAAAHASTINAVAAAIGPDRTIACPTSYWGLAPSGYRRQFGEILTPGIPVVWTGPSVISDSIDADDARTVAEELQHPLWIWDNYPVNDWDTDHMGAQLAGPEGIGNIMAPRRLPLAPLVGRDRRLAEVATAYGNDLAVDAHTGIPAVRTALDFAWDSASYDPQRSWISALTMSGLDHAALALLGDATGPVSGGGRRQPSGFAAACARTLIASPEERPAALTALKEVIGEHAAAIRSLRNSSGPLVRELRPWLDELGRQCAFATLAARTLGAERPQTGTIPLQLRDALGQPSHVSVASGAGRMLAEFARGIAAAGEPDIPA